MTSKHRIKQLEKTNGILTVKKYMCVIDEPRGADPEGYKIQPCNGTGGEPFHLATRDEVDAFGAQPDIDLTIVIFSDEEPDKGGDE